MSRIFSVVPLLSVVVILAGPGIKASEISWKLELDPRQIEISVSSQEGLKVAVPGYKTTNYLEYPAIPFRMVSVLIPQGEEVSSFRLEGGELVSLRESVSLSIFHGEYLDDGTIRGLTVEKGEVAGNDSVYPRWDVRYLGTRTYRGYRIAQFALYPFRYNLDSGDLTLHQGARLIVETRSATATDAIERLRYVEGFRERTRREVESMVVNPGDASSYFFNEIVVDRGDRGFMPSYLPSMEGSEVSYLIITNEEMAPVFQQLADWKTRKGIPAVVKTVEWIATHGRNGADRGETIRNFIKDAYSKWGVEWLLLAGDADIIPARMGYVTFYSGEFIPTDMYYSCLDGSWNADGDSLWGEAFHDGDDPGDEADFYAEVYVGRLPASTYAEAQVLVNKTISYATPVDTLSKRKYLLLGEVVFPSPYTYGMDIILHGSEIIDAFYDPYLAGNPDVTAVKLYETSELYPGSLELTRDSAVDSMNAGFQHVCHVGHGGIYNMAVGSGTILNFDAASLSNGDALFSMYLMNCTNVAYDKDCLAEAFLMNPNGGAFAITGASRSAFPSASRPYLDEYYHLLFTKDIVQLGKLHIKSREPYTPYSLGETADRWTHFIYNYLGDPEINMFRGEAKTFVVNIPSSVQYGTNSIPVHVTSGGSSFDSAYVCLYKEGDDYAHGYTNQYGNITFSGFLCREGGSVLVTVTGIDHCRYVDSILVDTEPDEYLRVSKVRVDDSSGGNDDALLDSGETVALEIKLHNTGGGNAQKLYAVIHCTDPLVDLTDSTSLYPNLLSGQEAYNLDPFVLNIDPGVADEQVVEFTIDIHDSTAGLWSEQFALEVHSPELELYINQLSDEAPYGNGNGVIEEDEDFLMRVGVKNLGTGTAVQLEGKIRSSSGNLVVTDSTSSYADMAIAETGFGEGFVLYESDTTVDNYFTFELTDGYGRVFSRSLELRRPASPGVLTLDASLGPNEIHVTWHAPDTLEAYRYLVYHATVPSGPYTQVSTDLIFHTLFRDYNLLSSTQYFYVICAVDSCGNLSDYSVEASASTNPPQLAGWPNILGKESSSSPAVGDIDGDTRPDVVVGSRYIYAWHADGIEIRDGDGQPITWGILTTLGDTYTASLALANLDGQPGLEVVGATWNTREIYVIDHDGNALPGWPKATVDLCWASPVVGDFDGDGDLEIIAYDVDGTVYVWHHDGTELMDGDSNPATDGPFFSAGLASDGWHVSTPALADMDEDNIPELIVCAPKDKIYCLNSNGTSVPGWPVALVDGANISASPAVGDVDNDTRMEVVVQDCNGWLYGLNHDGSSMTNWPRWIYSNNFFCGSPALADLTGDGKLEVVVPSMNSYCYIFKANGNFLTNWPQHYADSGPTEATPVIADIDGDGSLDIVLGCEAGRLNAWDINGDYIPGFPILLSGFIRDTPTVMDIDVDGDMELIATCWDQNVFVWDLNAQYYLGCNPWSGFHGNLYNSGWVDHVLATGVEQIACVYELSPSGIALNWSVLSGVESWNLYRRQGEEEFELIARGLNADGTNLIHYLDRAVEQGVFYSYRLEAANDRELMVETDRIEIPVISARLYQNYPNPFNPSTTISFTVPGSSLSRKDVLLAVYDIKGSLIRSLVNRPLSGGRHEVAWNGTNNRGEAVASGVYFSQLRIGGFREMKKMILLR
ncbi:MAG: VCBS repeat-containing protein [Candidatus Krumholzibacteriota bacterium]|nr:VCBS repeat-containing protein [Candidatus Krumholzibacteriota bacterium]